MPGLFGLTINKDTENLAPILSDTLNIHVNAPVHIRRDYSNEYIANCIVFFDFMKDYEFFYQIADLDIWIYGDPLIDGLTGKSALEKVAKIIAQSFPDFSGMANIDGLVTILIVNIKTKRLYIVGDRNGLAHLFYGVFNNQLIWGSELRTFVNRNLSTSIRKRSLTTYLELGYLIGNTTWFNEIQLLSPSSYLEWDLEKAEFIKIATYWSHKELKKESINRNSKQIVADLADLIAHTVSKRVPSEDRVGITLSGGQDSRAIFANIPHLDKNFYAITRGMKGCGDIILASKVAQLREDCTHVISDINENNWVHGRTTAVIATSGQKDLFNMNAVSSLSIHKNYFDINLDGAGGDAILKGGQLIFHKKENTETVLRNTYLKENYGNNESVLSELLDFYHQIDSDEYFYIYQRVRRFTLYGSVLGHDYGIISRFPLLDHQLLEYIYQLPANIDIGRVYNKMLIKYFPEYFVRIDNLLTGNRLFTSKKVNHYLMLLAIARSKAGFGKYKMKYHNYPLWLKSHDSTLIDQYALSKDLPLYRHVDFEPVRKRIEEFLLNGKNSRLISRVITLNIFLEYYTNEKIH